jgi:glycerol uptake facilitator protein
LIGFVVLAIGLSEGGTSGYAINPARDFGPRVLGAIVGTKGLFSSAYWFVSPIIATLIGGVVGALTYDWFVTANLPTKEEM